MANQPSDEQHKGLDLHLQRITSALGGLIESAMTNGDGHLGSAACDAFVFQGHVFSLLHSARWILSLAADVDTSNALRAEELRSAERDRQLLRLAEERRRMREAWKEKQLPFKPASFGFGDFDAAPSPKTFLLKETREEAPKTEAKDPCLRQCKAEPAVPQSASCTFADSSSARAEAAAVFRLAEEEDESSLRRRAGEESPHLSGKFGGLAKNLFALRSSELLDRRPDRSRRLESALPQSEEEPTALYALRDAAPTHSFAENS